MAIDEADMRQVGRGLDERILKKLSSLPPLTHELCGRVSESCRICGAPCLPFDVVDFNKFCSQSNFYLFGTSGIFVEYVRCTRCCFVFTVFFDSWSTHDFSRFIYNDDYIHVDGEYALARPSRDAETFARMFGSHANSRILDYGGGAGVFAAKLRTLGFSAVETYDPYTAPERPDGTFDILTCFEVLEHSPFPRATLQDMRALLRDDGFIIFSTGLQPTNINEIRCQLVVHRTTKWACIDLYATVPSYLGAVSWIKILLWRGGACLYRTRKPRPIVSCLCCWCTKILRALYCSGCPSRSSLRRRRGHRLR